MHPIVYTVTDNNLANHPNGFLSVENNFQLNLMEKNVAPVITGDFINDFTLIALDGSSYTIPFPSFTDENVGDVNFTYDLIDTGTGLPFHPSVIDIVLGEIKIIGNHDLSDVAVYNMEFRITD